MAAIIKAGTDATLKIRFAENDNVALPRVNGEVEWDSSDTAVCNVTASHDDPLEATLHAHNQIGPVQIHATAEIDDGEGPKLYTAMVDINVIRGDAPGYLASIDLQPVEPPEPPEPEGQN